MKIPATGQRLLFLSLFLIQFQLKMKIPATGQRLLFLREALERFATPELLNLFSQGKIDLCEVVLLEQTSVEIQPLFDDAEEKHFYDLEVQQWRDCLIQLHFEAEDILDEYADQLRGLKLDSQFESDQTHHLQEIKRFESKVRAINEKIKIEAQEGVALGLNRRKGSGSSRPSVFSTQRPQTSSLVNSSNVFGTVDNDHELKVLSDEDYFQMLLEIFGQEIVKKCSNGLPVAVKTLVGLILREKRENSEEGDILKKEIWDFTEKKVSAQGQNYCSNCTRQTPSSKITHRLARPFDVFINHRGPDTKSNVAVLLYYHICHVKLHPFLDCKSMKLGNELKEEINSGIRDCNVGVVIFSPNYCDSENCLAELAELMIKYKKKVIPIFYDVEPSQLVVVDDGRYRAKQLKMFRSALKLAKGRVGICFDSCNGDWSDLLKRVSYSVVEIVKKIEAEEKCGQHQ